jgi:hypothetical protein
VVTVSGLQAKFPNGYVVETIAAGGGVNAYDDVDFSDGIASPTSSYSTYYVANPINDGYRLGGTVGLNSPTNVFTGDTLYILPRPKTSGHRSPLAGFIITDQPVVSRTFPADSLVSSGNSFVLNATTLGVGNLSYQWQLNGTNIPGATFASYTNTSAAVADSGSYQLTVTSSLFPGSPATGDAVTVTVIPSHPPQTSTWDADTATTGAQDGSGTWTYLATNWWNGTGNDNWGSADSASFGTGGTDAYTVTLGADIAANAITFNSGSYTITNSASETLTLQGASIITAKVDATIAAPVTTTNTLTTDGPGTLTLSGLMSSTNTFVRGGTLEVLAKNGDSPYVVTNGATLKIGYSTGGGYAKSGLQLYGDGTAATTGLYLMGGTTYNVSGGVVVNGAPTTIRQYGSGLASFGIFDYNTNPGLSITAAASGSVVDANISMISRGYGMVITTAAGASSATGDLTLNGPLSVNTSGGLFKRGGGSLRLNAPALTNNLALKVQAGAVICGATDCIGTNANLVTSANTLVDLNGFSQTVATATLAGTLRLSINKGGSPVSTTLTCGTGSLSLGGSLVVTNLGGAPALGDTFTLLNAAGGIGGSFSSVTLPALSNGLGWQDNLAVDGTIKVVTGSTPPSIVTDLSTETSYAFVGSTRTFTVVAAGDPVLHYQWFKNTSTPVGTDSPTLVLSPVSLSDDGDYSVTVSNNYGSAPSQTTHLTVAQPSLAETSMAQNSPQSFWPLNEATAATAYDYAGTNNGLQSGALTPGADGPRPPAYQGFGSGTTAYQFDGSSSYVDCGNGPSISGTTDFSVEAWVKTTNAAASTIIQQRSSAGYNGTANGYNGEYQLNINANGTVYFMVYGGGTQFSFSSPATAKYVNDGRWHHVAAVRTATGGTIYIDGSAVATAAGATVPLDGSINTFIGFDQRDNVKYFNGAICDVAVYDSALTPAQIAQHAVTGVLATSPLQLNVVQGGFIEDSKPSGTAHPGFNYGTTWLTNSTDANSVSRTGVDQFTSGRQIAIPADADFNSPTGTICFWMRTPSPATGNGVMLVDRRTSAGLVMVLDGTLSGGLNIQYTGNSSFTAGGYVIDDNWHHVALVYDQSATGSVSVYIDGALAGTQANTAAWSWPASQQIELGRSHDTYWQNYSGQMDDFRIYNRVLSGSEIATLAAPGTSDTLVDTAALMVRYNFGTAAGVGQSLTWPVGSLESTPALESGSWTRVPSDNTSYQWLLPSGQPWTTNSALFYRVGF